MKETTEAEKMCIEILNWSERTERDFDTSFIESVLGQIYERDSVTDKQVYAVENIKDRFEVTTLGENIYSGLRDRYRAKFGKSTVEKTTTRGFM